MDIKKSSRFKDAVWFERDAKVNRVVVGGAGGIGSWLTLLLCRIGVVPYVYDFDTIEEHNIGGQLFGHSHIGKNKVSALNETCLKYASTSITTFNTPFDEKSLGSAVMFSAFDNMKARKDMFAVWKKQVEKYKSNPVEGVTPLFIDGRLLMEQLTIFCVTEENMDTYEKEHLFEDSEVGDGPCTLKQTSHSAAMIASHMVGFYTNHITNINQKSKDRNLPFMWEYFIPIDYVNTL